MCIAVVEMEDEIGVLGDVCVVEVDICAVELPVMTISDELQPSKAHLFNS